MSEITPTELSSRLEADDGAPFVLDIRPADDFAEWHVPGSENIDVYEALKDDPESTTTALSEVPADEEVVTVCAAGVISRRATERMQEMGYDAKTLVDGMNGWSRVHRSAETDVDIDGTLVQVARPGKGCLSYVLVSDGEAAVFDPSQYADEYESVIADYGVELTGVFDTHAHADHVSGGVQLADSYDVPYHLHPADALDIDATPLEDGQAHTIGDVDVEAIHTPGHSPGAISFALNDGALVTGDTLFHESVGRVELGVEAGLEGTDVEENAATLYESLQRLLDREGDPLVLPAHDSGSPDPPVTQRLSTVLEQNADLGRDRQEFVETLSSDTPEHPPNFQRVKRVNVGSEDIPEDELAELELGPNRCAAE